MDYICRVDFFEFVDTIEIVRHDEAHQYYCRTPKVTKWLLIGSMLSYGWRVFSSHAGGVFNSNQSTCIDHCQTHTSYRLKVLAAQQCFKGAMPRLSEAIGPRMKAAWLCARPVSAAAHQPRRAAGHRYFAHLSFKTTRWLEMLMAITIQACTSPSLECALVQCPAIADAASSCDSCPRTRPDTEARSLLLK